MPAFSRAASAVVRGDAAASLRSAARPSGNFEIFRLASRHLLAGDDLYAEYPAEHSDRFKYSPTFALLFEPFAWLPWPLALFLWNSLNAVLLFLAVERVLSARAALIAQSCLLLEVLRGMQNAQSNALVAALIIFTFVALEKLRLWQAAAATVLGASVKIFPLVALTFAIPRRRTIRTGLLAAGAAIVALALPLLVTSPSTLLAQYASWRAVESFDAGQRWFSVMELVHRWTGLAVPNWPIQLAGTIALLAPLAVRRNRWDEAPFRFLYLCSVLLYVVLFNHQAERASFLIAFVGATLWFADNPTPLRTLLFGAAFVSIPLLSTLVPGRIWREETIMLYRLAIPTLAIWIAVQRSLWRRTVRVSDQASVA